MHMYRPESQSQAHMQELDTRKPIAFQNVRKPIASFQNFRKSIILSQNFRKIYRLHYETLKNLSFYPKALEKSIVCISKRQKIYRLDNLRISETLLAKEIRNDHPQKRFILIHPERNGTNIAWSKKSNWHSRIQDFLKHLLQAQGYLFGVRTAFK